MHLYVCVYLGLVLLAETFILGGGGSCLTELCLQSCDLGGGERGRTEKEREGGREEHERKIEPTKKIESKNYVHPMLTASGQVQLAYFLYQIKRGLSHCQMPATIWTASWRQATSALSDHRTVYSQSHLYTSLPNM